MVVIKPSEGLQNQLKTVFVEGIIADTKYYSDSHGGRWLVKIADSNSATGHSNAVLVLNKNPNQNPSVHALGIENPNQAILKLFSEESFQRLFQPNMPFRAEAVVGVFGGIAWFNVSQIILFNPTFKIGTRQIYNEPICERRLLLRARGIKGNRVKIDENITGLFIGKVVHTIFQLIVTSPNPEQLIGEFRNNPNGFLIRVIQPETFLMNAIGQIDENNPLISINVWTIIRNQVERLLNSGSIQKLIASEPGWVSEVPVSGTSIHGDIDLRSKTKILELKTGKPDIDHDDQLSVYLVGEMLEHGFSIKNHREGYLIYSSGEIMDDDLRVQKLSGNSPKTFETLQRFLISRHRLLLVSSGAKLPKIELDPAVCRQEKCEYYSNYSSSDNINEFGSGCHFYCQTDRNWSCDGCFHSASCREYSKYHPFEVLDVSNRIRKALTQEIELVRSRNLRAERWKAKFEVIDNKVNQCLHLKPLSGFLFDPPTPGEKILIKSESTEYPTNGFMVGVDENNDWMILDKGTVLREKGEIIEIIQSRSALNGIYHLQGCIDELQRLENATHREGISFAGGAILSDRLDIQNDLNSVISNSSITDIFCQSFEIKISKKILHQITNLVEGRLLIIADTQKTPIEKCSDLRGSEFIKIISEAQRISDVLATIKQSLENNSCWLISPDILFNSEIFKSIPNQGIKFFDFIVIYESNKITGLEYFLLRQYAKRLIVIGDANCVGRPLYSQQSKILGLGENLLTRVNSRGFPSVENKMFPKLLFLEGQEVDSKINRALKSCRLLSSDQEGSKIKIDIDTYNLKVNELTDQLVYSVEVDVAHVGPSKELNLIIDEVISEIEIEDDLRELKPQVNNSLIEDKVLTIPNSGRYYRVKQAPYLRENSHNKWLVNFYVKSYQLNTSDLESDIVIKKVQELKSLGVKSKNLAIISPSISQLKMIYQKGESELQGIALRTPYGINGEIWGNVIISCAANSAQEIDSREFYTMVRASSSNVFIFGSSNVINYHPFLRSII